MKTTRSLLTAALVSLVACSESGPPPIRTGTPAYYFQNAKDTYSKGDYVKAIDWLDKITKANKNEFTERAWTFRLLLEAGMISGYKELADNYEYGQRSNKDNPTPFIKKVTEYRSTAQRMALPFASSMRLREGRTGCGDRDRLPVSPGWLHQQAPALREDHSGNRAE
jgi:hypothetical protein